MHKSYKIFLIHFLPFALKLYLLFAGLCFVACMSGCHDETSQQMMAHGPWVRSAQMHYGTLLLSVCVCSHLKMAFF